MSLSYSEWVSRRGVKSAPRLETIFSVLTSRPPGRLLDLGAGHGLFSLMAADLGWEATAVDGRNERFPTDSRVTWVVSDVRDFEIMPGAYDLILNLGLLYHLEPDDQLALLKACSTTVTVIDTHVASKADATTHGLRGTWFAELVTEATASIGNARSFWPIESDLIAQFRMGGFGMVWRLTPETSRGRTFWLCMPGWTDMQTPTQEQRHASPHLVQHELAELRARAATASDQATPLATPHPVRRYAARALGALTRRLDPPPNSGSDRRS